MTSLVDIPQPASCPVCQIGLVLRPAQGRKSKKPFLMWVCPSDARHLRGFITDQTYVKEILARLEDLQ